MEGALVRVTAEGVLIRVTEGAFAREGALARVTEGALDRVMEGGP